MDQLEARVMVLEAKMDWSESTFGKIDRDLKAIDHRMERLETRMDGLERKLDGFETRLNGIENEVHILGIRMEERFKSLVVEMNERMKSLGMEMNERFKIVEERFKRTDLLLKILIALSLLGLTFANPGFTGLVERLLL